VGHTRLWQPRVELQGALAELHAAVAVRAGWETVLEDSDMVYTHDYAVADLVMWDNLSVWHRGPAQTMVASAEDPSARVLYRASVKGPPAITLPRRDGTDWLRQHISGSYATPLEDILEPTGPPVGLPLGIGEFLPS
jgi:hypothetical protein